MDTIRQAQEAIALLERGIRIEEAMSNLKLAEQLSYKDITIYNLLQEVKKFLEEERKECIEKSLELK
mgnify:CR=1 FL=1|tara:strand:+ start:609 stop:809 length:201 start_codon:yes stop_codon:yes gene_type:complete